MMATIDERLARLSPVASSLMSDILLLQESEIKAIHYTLFTRTPLPPSASTLVSELSLRVFDLPDDDRREMLLILNMRREQLIVEAAQQAVEAAADRSKRVAARHEPEEENPIARHHPKRVSKAAIKNLL